MLTDANTLTDLQFRVLGKKKKKKEEALFDLFVHRGSWNAGQRRDNNRLSRGCRGTGRITEGEALRLRVMWPKVHVQKYVMLLKHTRTHKIQQFPAKERGILCFHFTFSVARADGTDPALLSRHTLRCLPQMSYFLLLCVWFLAWNDYFFHYHYWQSSLSVIQLNSDVPVDQISWPACPHSALMWPESPTHLLDTHMHAYTHTFCDSMKCRYCSCAQSS